MRLLLDQGVARGAIAVLRAAGHDVVHVGDVGMSRASDEAILAHAKAEDRVVVTLDADFHALLARSGAMAPSVLRLRAEGVSGAALGAMLALILSSIADDLSHGAVATAEHGRVRVRRLPLM